MRNLAKSYVSYGVIKSHVDDFIEVFIILLQETFLEITDKHLFDIWKIMISEIMN